MNAQRGQSMAEYTIVVVALVAGLLMVNQGCSGSGHSNCINWLLATMRDNYEGYSYSVSAVQDYNRVDPDYVDDGDDGGDGSGDDGDDGSGTGTGIPGADGLTQTNALYDPLGNALGTLQGDNTVVDADGEEVGVYDPDTGTFTYTSGSQAGQTVNDPRQVAVVQDEDGNVLELKAVFSTVFPDIGVIGFGYQSQVDGDFFRQVDLEQTDLPVGTVLQDTYKVYKAGGGEETGRIVGSRYYADTFSFGNVISPAGKVVEVDFGGGLPPTCLVVVDAWDGDEDTLNDSTIGYKEFGVPCDPLETYDF